MLRVDVRFMGKISNLEISTRCHVVGKPFVFMACGCVQMGKLHPVPAGWEQCVQTVFEELQASG